MNTFAEELKTRREGANLSRKELADLVGCHFTTIHDWEKGQAAPTPRYFQKLCTTTGWVFSEIPRIRSKRKKRGATRVDNSSPPWAIESQATPTQDAEAQINQDALVALIRRNVYETVRKAMQDATEEAPRPSRRLNWVIPSLAACIGVAAVVFAWPI